MFRKSLALLFLEVESVICSIYILLSLVYSLVCSRCMRQRVSKTSFQATECDAKCESGY